MIANCTAGRRPNCLSETKKVEHGGRVIATRLTIKTNTGKSGLQERDPVGIKSLIADFALSILLPVFARIADSRHPTLICCFPFEPHSCVQRRSSCRLLSV